ncbi:MAG TPA: hypothetical protein VHG91_21275 [Longimicrobium sp.]|nr:hypothetical protein [Longimicrobium sp.]
MTVPRALFALAVAASLGFGGRAAAAAPRTECQSTYPGVPAYCSPRFDCDAACDAATGTPDSYGLCSSRGCCICISAGVG